MIIYKITNKINGKSYIGQTTQKLHRRIKDHKGRHNRCSAIGNAIKKYGMGNFDIVILEECNSRESLNKKEIHYIDEYNTLSPNGYNLRDGGLQFEMTSDQKVKISKTLKDKNIKPPSRLGAKLSEEQKRSISLANKGRINTKEAIQKMLKNRSKTNNRAVLCVNDGMTYNSMSEASKRYNINITSIWRVCTGLKDHHKQFIFKYLENS